MYYDLLFPFRIKAEAGIAQDEEGNNAEAYMLTTLGQCKAPLPTEEKYNEMHNGHKYDLAKLLGIKDELVVCITPEEYEANADDKE